MLNIGGKKPHSKKSKFVGHCRVFVGHSRSRHNLQQPAADPFFYGEE